MSEAVWVALITGVAGVLGGFVAKMGIDKYKVNRNGDGSGHIESVISRRAEVEFQTRMTVLMGQLTNAIERGHDRSLAQMEMVSESISDAAASIREVHQELVGHRKQAAPAMLATLETHRLVQEMRAERR